MYIGKNVIPALFLLVNIEGNIKASFQRRLESSIFWAKKKMTIKPVHEMLPIKQTFLYLLI